MSTAIPTELANVTAATRANIYFDGKVISHTLIMPDGVRKTLGVIQPGTYHFGTDAPERMEMVAGGCRVRLDGTDEWTAYLEGSTFELPGKSGFDIEVAEGVAQYICTFL